MIVLNIFGALVSVLILIWATEERDVIWSLFGVALLAANLYFIGQGA